MQPKTKCSPATFIPTNSTSSVSAELWFRKKTIEFDTPTLAVGVPS